MPNEPVQKAIAAQLDLARRDLLDLGMRNSLLNYRTPKTRGVEVTHRSSANVFTWLVNEDRELSFIPIPDGASDDGARDSSRRTADSPDRLGLPVNVHEKALQGRLL